MQYELDKAAKKVYFKDNRITKRKELIIWRLQ